MCGRDNPYDFQYDINGEGVEKNQPSYLVDGPNGYLYNDVEYMPEYLLKAHLSS